MRLSGEANRRCSASNTLFFSLLVEYYSNLYCQIDSSPSGFPFKLHTRDSDNYDHCNGFHLIPGGGITGAGICYLEDQIMPFQVFGTITFGSNHVNSIV